MRPLIALPVTGAAPAVAALCRAGLAVEAADGETVGSLLSPGPGDGLRPAAIAAAALRGQGRAAPGPLTLP